jgi:nucleoside-diphosphate-sugar epimerase
METVNAGKPVAVTGGSGYIASWIVKYLLDQGYTVRTSVRKLSDKEKYRHLTQAAANSPGKLEVFEADLMIQASFDSMIDGCEVVIHTASPFRITGVKDFVKEVIDPALVGTQNVLGSVNRSSTVKKVILTASVASVYGDAADISGKDKKVFTGKDWNTTSTVSHQPYSYSKTVAEKEAWNIASGQSRWELVTVHPGFVLGPSLTPRTDSTSIDFMISFMKGQFRFGSPDLWFGIVDVRDAALMHILAAFNPDASGRYIAVEGSHSMTTISGMITSQSAGKYKASSRALPSFLFYLFGPLMGFSLKYVKRNIGIPISFDNSKAKEELGMIFRPLEETIRDHMLQIESLKSVV